MPTGDVGGGHQNKYETEGSIFQKDPVPGKTKPQPLLFKKSLRTPNSNRNESECWNAGTPVRWEENEVKVENGIIRPVQAGKEIPEINVTEAPCEDSKGKVNILATLDKAGEPIEYHPLIQFYNEVLARLFATPNGRKMLDGVTKPDKALALWRYLEKEYL